MNNRGYIYIKKIILALVSICLLTCTRNLPMPIKTTNFWIEEPDNVPIIDRFKGILGWDYVSADNPFIFTDNQKYYCFYEGENKERIEQIGVAYSDDFVNWKKYENNPILTIGKPEDWDSKSVKIPVVIKKDDTYYMLYTGMGDNIVAIGLATSKDLFHWEKYPNNPVMVGRKDSWNPLITTCPNIVLKDGKYYIVYRGMKNLYKEQKLGIAYSDDLTNWTMMDKPLTGFDDTLSFSILYEPNTNDYWGIPENSSPKYYYFSKDLVNWRQGHEILFSTGLFTTPSQPIYINNKYWVFYEKLDRIYKSYLVQIDEGSIHLATQKIPFTDDFSSVKKSRAAWKENGGKWIFSEGALRQLSRVNDVSICYVNTPDIKNCGMRLQIKILDEKGFVGISLLTQKENYYFSITADKTNNAAFSKSDAIKPNEIKRLNQERCVINPQVLYNLEFEFFEDIIRCSVDNKLIIQRIADDIITGAKFGCFTFSCAAVITNAELYEVKN